MQTILNNSQTICQFLNVADIVALSSTNRLASKSFDLKFAPEVMKKLFSIERVAPYMVQECLHAKALSELVANRRHLRHNEVVIYSHSSHDYDQVPENTFKSEANNSYHMNPLANIQRLLQQGLMDMEIGGGFSMSRFWSSKGLNTQEGAEYISFGLKATKLCQFTALEIEFFKEFFPCNSVKLLFSMEPLEFSFRNAKVGSQLISEQQSYKEVSFEVKGKVHKHSRNIELKLPRPHLAKFVTVQFIQFPRAQLTDQKYYMALSNIKIVGWSIDLLRCPSASRLIFGCMSNIGTDGKSPSEAMEEEPASLRCNEGFDLTAIHEAKMLRLKEMASQSPMAELYSFCCQNQLLKRDRRSIDVFYSAVDFDTEAYVKLASNYGSLLEAELGIILNGYYEAFIESAETVKDTDEAGHEAAMVRIDKSIGEAFAVSDQVVTKYRVSLQSMPHSLIDRLSRLGLLERFVMAFDLVFEDLQSDYVTSTKLHQALRRLSKAVLTASTSTSVDRFEP